VVDRAIEGRVRHTPTSRRRAAAQPYDPVPLTYAVDPLRRLVFDHLDISEASRRTLAPGVTWWGWRVPSLREVAIVLALGVAMLEVAVARFIRTE
jgi:ABC-2 type transport system permease protein